MRYHLFLLYLYFSIYKAKCEFQNLPKSNNISKNVYKSFSHQNMQFKACLVLFHNVHLDWESWNYFFQIQKHVKGIKNVKFELHILITETFRQGLFWQHLIFRTNRDFLGFDMDDIKISCPSYPWLNQKLLFLSCETKYGVFLPCSFAILNVLVFALAF